MVDVCVGGGGEFGDYFGIGELYGVVVGYVDFGVVVGDFFLGVLWL